MKKQTTLGEVRGPGNKAVTRQFLGKKSVETAERGRTSGGGRGRKPKSKGKCWERDTSVGDPEKIKVAGVVGEGQSRGVVGGEEDKPDIEKTSQTWEKKKNPKTGRHLGKESRPQERFVQEEKGGVHVKIL